MYYLFDELKSKHSSCLETYVGLSSNLHPYNFLSIAILKCKYYFILKLLKRMNTEECLNKYRTTIFQTLLNATG